MLSPLQMPLVLLYLIVHSIECIRTTFTSPHKSQQILRPHHRIEIVLIKIDDSERLTALLQPPLHS